MPKGTVFAPLVLPKLTPPAVKVEEGEIKKINISGFLDALLELGDRAKATGWDSQSLHFLLDLVEMRNVRGTSEFLRSCRQYFLTYEAQTLQSECCVCVGHQHLEDTCSSVLDTLKSCRILENHTTCVGTVFNAVLVLNKI